MCFWLLQKEAEEDKAAAAAAVEELAATNVSSGLLPCYQL